MTHRKAFVTDDSRHAGAWLFFGSARPNACLWGTAAIIAILVCLFPVKAVLGAEPPVQAKISKDKRSFEIVAPGLRTFQASWSATIVRAGHEQVLSSADGLLKNGTELTIRFPEAEVDLLFRLEQVPDASAVFAQAGIRNTGTTPVHFATAIPVAAIFQPREDLAQWLVTGLHPRTPALVALRDIHSPLTIHEHGGCYRKDGTGFLFGPVGDPSAYVNAQFAATGPDDKVHMSFAADMSGVRVDPGETRWGQQVALVFEQPQPALNHWVGWVAQSHGARTSKGALTGWNNAHPLKKTNIRKELTAVIEAVRQSNGQLRPGLIQIEDADGDPGNRTTLDAPWVPECAEQVRALGARFGIRLGFDEKADRNTVTDTVRHAVQRGFSYLNIDRPATGLPREERRTAFETCRDEFAAIRRAAGEEMYLSYCGDAPNRAVVGLVDASRVGRDTKRDGLRPAMDDVLRSYPLCGRWFAGDFDNFYLGTWRQNESQIEGGWELARTWLTLVGLSGGVAITSDPLYSEDFKQFWQNFQILSPPLQKSAAVLDICTNREWPRLITHVHREWGNWTVALLWNPTQREQSFTLDFAKAGMDPRRTYAVYGVWDNRLLGVVQGAWGTHHLEPGAPALIRFTELDPRQSRPILIGSRLHISCGDAEIKAIDINQARMTIELTGAGARNGDLFIHSRYPPILNNVTGCEVTGITIVGENVWRIGIKDRKLDATQRVELAILLPVTKQLWFWLLIATAAGSPLIAVWRYIISLRFQRKQALAEERSRIAQDLHDDLGANLSQIAFHGDSVLATQGLNPDHIARIEKMRTMARGMTRALDEIVWAIDPGKDKLEYFVGYIISFAQEMLSDAGVACRFSFPHELPVESLSSEARHHLFLAFKEALHNIIRHSKATEVKIQFAIHAKECELAILDNGSGFDPAIVGSRPGGGRGLTNLRNRMLAVGGHCEIQSHPGTGTKLRLIWKLNSRKLYS